MFGIRYDVLYQKAGEQHWGLWSTRDSKTQGERSAKECQQRFPGAVTKVKRRKEK